jgi:hypothetical protein
VIILFAMKDKEMLQLFGNLVSVGILNVCALCFLWGKVEGIRIWILECYIKCKILRLRLMLTGIMISPLIINCLSPFGLL